jgi:FlaA1/EpsC-like NDP-sugar epimerase
VWRHNIDGAYLDAPLPLSGLSVRDAHHPNGGIEIVGTGLRPGEKLYEELLIDADSQPTIHPLIYRAQEQALAPDLLWPSIDAMEAAIQRQDVERALDLLATLVPEWTRGNGDPQGAALRSGDAQARLTRIGS